MNTIRRAALSWWAAASGLACALPAAAAPADTIRIVTGPYLQEMGTDRVTVMVQTDKPAVAEVQVLGPDDVPAGTFRSCRAGMVQVGTVHAVPVTGLAPGTTYRYTVKVKELADLQPYHVDYGTTAESGPWPFTTWAENPAKVSFVVFNDIHSRADLLASLFRAGAAATADLVFFNGDMVQDGVSPEEFRRGFLDRSVELFARSKPFVYVHGNHEMRGGFARGLGEWVPHSSGAWYYLFRCGGVCFMVLDSGEDKPDDAPVYGGLLASDSYRAEQTRWLAQAVRTPAWTEAAFRIVLSHIQPEGCGGEGWHTEQAIRRDWLPILARSGADLMLCGHEHRLVDARVEDPAGAVPVLVNSDHHVVRVEIEGRELNLKVLDHAGRIALEKTIPAK